MTAKTEFEGLSVGEGKFILLQGSRGILGEKRWKKVSYV
jgi:hypothetical protein